LPRGTNARLNGSTTCRELKLNAGDPAGALEVYLDGLAIAERLAARDGGNALWQRDLVAARYKLAQAGEDARAYLAKALEIVEAMQRKGVLAPYDAFLPLRLSAELAKLK
jgi:glutathione S-transferase